MGTRKEHILVVDDDELIREVLIAALAAAGYAVVRWTIDRRSTRCMRILR